MTTSKFKTVQPLLFYVDVPKRLKRPVIYWISTFLNETQTHSYCGHTLTVASVVTSGNTYYYEHFPDCGYSYCGHSSTVFT